MVDMVKFQLERVVTARNGVTGPAAPEIHPGPRPALFGGPSMQLGSLSFLFLKSLGSLSAWGGRWTVFFFLKKSWTADSGRVIQSEVGTGAHADTHMTL